MRYPRIQSMAVVLGAVAFFSMAGAGVAAEPSRDVATAVGELDRWLGSSDYVKTWNIYLLTDQLKGELAKPDQADPKKLAAVLARYDSGASGLDKPRFVAVRTALAQWVEAREESTLPARAELPKMAEKIQDQLGPKTEAEVARSKEELRVAANRLGEYLDANGRKGSDWKRYLLWQRLSAALAAKTPDNKDVKTVLDRFEADKDGLEMSQYIAVRDALRKYYHMEQARNLSNVGQGLIKRVEGLPAEPRLQALLKDYGPETKHVGAVKVGAYMGELERFHQAQTLVRAVRRHLSHPNLTAYASADFIAAALGEHLNEQIEVEENILGTYVTGTGHLTGDLAATLVPDEQKGAIRVALSGTTKTKTTGYNGPVAIYSSGVTQLEGATQIEMTPEGVSHTSATGKAVTKTNVEGLSTKRNGPIGRIIERAAWKKVGESKSEAEQIAAQRATKRLKERMNQQADKSLSKANHDYAYKFRDPMIRRSAFPSLLSLKTTASAIELLMQQAAADQLAAPTAPQPLEQKHDMAVRLHESFANNLIATRLGGQTITDKSAADSGQTPEQAEKMKANINKQKARNRVERFAKLNDEEKKVEMARREKADKEQKFSMTLARLNPVSVEFRDRHVKVTIRGTVFEGIDGRTYDEHPMSIWALYKIDIAENGGLSLVMNDLDSDWGVMTTQAEYGEPAAPGAEILRAKLKARFGDIITDLYRVELDSLLLPGNLERAGRLAFKQADSQGGWLTLAWDRMAKTAKSDKVTTR